ncbi:MAG TPA: O-antigen ligase family protein [Candidatus Aquilonibacter sp.]|nr:O-antigen ligase family protein [Candidatus Aquilonibacter sp.]
MIVNATTKLFGQHRADLSVSPFAVLALSAAAGIAVAFAMANSHVFVDLAGAAVTLVLLLFPEFVLAFYVVVGDVKGDDRVASLLPFDWTIALGAVLVAGIILNVLRGRRIAKLPPAYFLLGAFTVWMAASLVYTPVFDAGLEKLGRFVTVTGIVIVAPFFVLGTRAAMNRFLAAFGAAAFGICAYALLGLGSSDRLVSPSDNTIGLGHVACALVMLIWFAAIPRDRWPLRIIFYALFAVPAVALIGSGSRGSAIACVLAILLSLYFCRQRITDLVLIGAGGLLAIPFLGIPQASLDYLATLVKSGSVNALLDFRSDLLGYGWELLQQHPLIGAGIDGFQYSSPNPNVYKWPHNVFLEVACELGIPALLLIVAFFGSALRESWRQLRLSPSVCGTLPQLAGAWLLLGLVNALNTGDINSDRTTWLFASIVFVIGTYTCSSDLRKVAEPAASSLA